MSHQLRAFLRHLSLLVLVILICPSAINAQIVAPDDPGESPERAARIEAGAPAIPTLTPEAMQALLDQRDQRMAADQRIPMPDVGADAPMDGWNPRIAPQADAPAQDQQQELEGRLREMERVRRRAGNFNGWQVREQRDRDAGNNHVYDDPAMIRGDQQRAAERAAMRGREMAQGSEYQSIAAFYQAQGRLPEREWIMEPGGEDGDRPDAENDGRRLSATEGTDARPAPAAGYNVVPPERPANENYVPIPVVPDVYDRVPAERPANGNYVPIPVVPDVYDRVPAERPANGNYVPIPMVPDDYDRVPAERPANGNYVPIPMVPDDYDRVPAVGDEGQRNQYDQAPSANSVEHERALPLDRIQDQQIRNPTSLVAPREPAARMGMIADQVNATTEQAKRLRKEAADKAKAEQQRGTQYPPRSTLMEAGGEDEDRPKPDAAPGNPPRPERAADGGVPLPDAQNHTGNVPGARPQGQGDAPPANDRARTTGVRTDAPPARPDPRHTRPRSVNDPGPVTDPNKRDQKPRRRGRR